MLRASLAAHSGKVVMTVDKLWENVYRTEKKDNDFWWDSTDIVESNNIKQLGATLVVSSCCRNKVYLIWHESHGMPPTNYIQCSLYIFLMGEKNPKVNRVNDWNKSTHPKHWKAQLQIKPFYEDKLHSIYFWVKNANVVPYQMNLHIQSQ